jgi:hypothetical protein
LGDLCRQARPLLIELVHRRQPGPVVRLGGDLLFLRDSRVDLQGGFAILGHELVDGRFLLALVGLEL